MSVGLIDLLGGAAAAAVTCWFVWMATSAPMAYTAENAQLPIVQQSHEWWSTLLTQLPTVFLLMISMGTIAFAVYQTRFA